MAQAAVHSLPWGETCSSESWRAVNHLAFGFASVTGSVGLLCQGGTYSGWKKGAAPWQFYTAPPSPLQQSIKGLWGSPGGAITVNFRASPLVGAFYSFIRTLLPRMLHWSTDSWLLKVTVAQDQRMQKRFLDSVKEEGLKN